MKIENYSILEVFPYAKNNRKHSEKQIERIADSIKKFGFNQPLVIDELNEILVGHGRLEAAKILHLDSVPCIKILNLSENEKRAYRILDNKLQNDSEWDFESLQDEIKFLSENDFDISFCGLNELSELFPVEEQEITEDNFEIDENTNTLIKLGDLIELGQHKVLCVNSFEAPLDDFDILLTDPPYGISFQSNYRIVKHDPIANDDFFPVQYLTSAVERSLKASYIFCRWDNISEMPKPKSVLAWIKNNWSMGDFKHEHGRQWEACLFYKGKQHEFIKRISDVIHDDRTGNELHPTQKPVKLLAEIIKANKGDKVFDPFLGSGTTLIACEQLGRICYGMEISPKYCQVIIDRYHNYCEKNNKEFVCKINGESYHG